MRNSAQNKSHPATTIEFFREKFGDESANDLLDEQPDEPGVEPEGGDD